MAEDIVEVFLFLNEDSVVVDQLGGDMDPQNTEIFFTKDKLKKVSLCA